VRLAFLLVLTASCAAAAPATSPAPAPTDSTTSAPSSDTSSAPAASSPPAPAAATDATPPATPAGPVPIGGSVLVGDINAPPHFDPKPTIVALKPKLLECFNQARASNPALHGKLTVRIQVNEAGAALSADADPGGNAYDPGLVKCIDGVVKNGVKFPKPGGMATVAAPLVFRP
jgi:hypothetical protein